MALTKVITGVTDLNQAQSTNGLKFPTGDVFAGTPEEGMIRNDQSQASEGSASTMQFYNGTAWKNFVNKVPLISVDYLVVAGGGGGGGWGGGGGAGGLITNYGGTSLTLASATNYTVSIGDGGTAGYYTSSYFAGGNGSNSYISGTGLTTITTIGGGGGGKYLSPYGTDGAAGGSGGGAGATSAGQPGSGSGGTGAAGQGNDGASSGSGGSFYPGGGGGGGAGTAGIQSSTNEGGAGGDGLQYNITGTNIYYAGGGSGLSSRTDLNPGVAGGSGGGGTGGRYATASGTVSSTAAVNGTDGLGGGGGGAYGLSPYVCGAGGSGVVILRYPSAYTITAGGSLTSSTATVGTDKVTTFTAGSDTITFS